MTITLKCAWCGIQIGVGNRELTGGTNISHGICPACQGKLLGVKASKPGLWDGIDRRRANDRRVAERRLGSVDDVDDLLVVVNGPTWVDGKRRIKIPRIADRMWLANGILFSAF
jgi:hypothetical protein